MSGDLSYHSYLLLDLLLTYIEKSFVIVLATPKTWAEKSGSNRQNPEPTVKSLFCITQCIHHFATDNNQVNECDKLSDLTVFKKPACRTASLAQQIDLINRRWLQHIIESLVSHFRERIDNFKRQLPTFRLNHSDSEKAQKNGHIKT